MCNACPGAERRFDRGASFLIATINRRFARIKYKSRATLRPRAFAGLLLPLCQYRTVFPIKSRPRFYGFRRGYLGFGKKRAEANFFFEDIMYRRYTYYIYIRSYARWRIMYSRNGIIIIFPHMQILPRFLPRAKCDRYFPWSGLIFFATVPNKWLSLRITQINIQNTNFQV